MSNYCDKCNVRISDDQGFCEFSGCKPLSVCVEELCVDVGNLVDAINGLKGEKKSE